MTSYCCGLVTDSNVSVTRRARRRATRPASRTIAPHLTHACDTPGRVYRRRRLGVLTACLLAVVGIAAVAGGSGSDEPVAVTAGRGVAAQSGDEPAGVRRVVPGTSVTSSTATSTSTTPSTTPASPTGGSSATTSAPPDAAPSPPATTSTPASTTPPTAPPATTAPPTTATPTTAAPTTAPPEPVADEAGGEYAYGDPRGVQVWLDLAHCESHGNWQADTGNGYYGGLQFSLGAWQGVGGSGYPHEHPRDTQIEMGRRLQARHGWGAWPHCAEELGLR